MTLMNDNYQDVMQPLVYVIFCRIMCNVHNKTQHLKCDCDTEEFD